MKPANALKFSISTLGCVLFYSGVECTLKIKLSAKLNNIIFWPSGHALYTMKTEKGFRSHSKMTSGYFIDFYTHSSGRSVSVQPKSWLFEV